ncbi:lactose permease [Xylariales sp. PMI_506]|nr:lactose permease [Xylariales sp. PMI_506]
MGIDLGHAADPIVTTLVNEDKVPWYKKPNLRRMYLWLFLCCMGVEITSGFDSQLLNTLQFSDPFNRYFGNGYKSADGTANIEPSLLGFVTSCYQLGSVLAVPAATWYNHRYGRRSTIMTGSILMVIGALLQGFAQHVGMYIVSRMILGAGILFAIIAGSALLGELGHPKERSTLTSYFNSSYFLGAIIAAAISLATTTIPGDWSWRLPSLLQICPSLLQLTTVYLLPESPRWLVSKDRHDEAYAILTKYHAEGDETSLLVKAEMAQIKAAIQIEAENSKESWLAMVQTKGMRRRVFIAAFLGLFTQMSGNTLLSYFSNQLFPLMGYTSSYAKTRINIANQCWSFFTATLTASFITKFPRRWGFMTSSSSMCFAFIGMTVSLQQCLQAKAAGTKNPAASIAALFFFFAYTPCYNIGNNTLTYTYLIELFPFAQRARGIGVEQIFGKLAGFFSTNINPLALNAITWKYLAIYCGWIAFEFIFQFSFYPETHGRTLEELAFLFEDNELNEKTSNAVVKEIGRVTLQHPDEGRA